MSPALAGPRSAIPLLAVVTILLLACCTEVLVAQSAPYTVGAAGGPMLRLDGEGQSAGPGVSIQVGSQAGPRARLQLVFEGAWRRRYEESGEREERLAGAAEVLLYAREGARGGYLIAGMGVASYAQSLTRSGLLPAAHVGIGASAPVGALSLFAETRVVRTFDAESFPGWTVSAQGGVRVRL